MSQSFSCIGLNTEGKGYKAAINQLKNLIDNQPVEQQKVLKKEIRKQLCTPQQKPLSPALENRNSGNILQRESPKNPKPNTKPNLSSDAFLDELKEAQAKTKNRMDYKEFETKLDKTKQQAQANQVNRTDGDNPLMNEINNFDRAKLRPVQK